MIPKVIHRIWIGAAEPPDLEAMTRSWRTHFPDYRLEWWTGERLADLGMPVHWHRAHTYAEKADIARYLLLHRFGGIYADCDVRPLQRFDHLWEDTDSLVAFQESSDLVWNGLIIASVGARVLALSSRLADRSARRHAPTAAPNVRTGPFIFTAAIDYERFIDPRGIRVYPPGFAHVRGGAACPCRGVLPVPRPTRVGPGPGRQVGEDRGRRLEGHGGRRRPQPSSTAGTGQTGPPFTHPAATATEGFAMRRSPGCKSPGCGGA